VTCLNERFTLLMLGNYLPKNARRGGPGQIFSLFVDEFVNVSKRIRNLEIVVIDTKIPFYIYTIRKGTIIKKNLPLTPLASLGTLKRTKAVYLTSLSIMGFSIFMLAWLLRKKTFYHLHGIERLEYRYEEKNLLTSLPYIGIERFLIKNSSALIHVSKLYEKITKDLYNPSGSSFIIPNSLDLESSSFDNLKKLISKEITLPKRYVLFIGRPTRRKGFDIFLILMNKVMERYNDLQAIAVTGDVIKGREKLKKYIKKQEIRKRIHILGSLDKNYLFILYQGALATLIPSLVESFNMVALESLAAGTPVIISSMAGVAEYLPKNSQCVSICDSLTSFLESLEKHLKDEIRFDKSSCTSIARNFNVKITVLRLLKVLLIHYTTF